MSLKKEQRNLKKKDKIHDQERLNSINNAYDTLSESFISKAEINEINVSSSTTQVFNSIVKLLYIESKKPNISTKSFDKIKRYSQGLSYDGRAKTFTIKEYSLSSWLDSIDYIACWLKDNKLDADLSSIVDYIACSSEAVNLTSDNLELVQIVKDFLNDFGFENSFKVE